MTGSFLSVAGVGVSYRQSVLHQWVESGIAMYPKSILAQLVLDEGNPADSDAVAVFLGKSHVGFLAKANYRPTFVKSLHQLRKQRIPGLVRALIVKSSGKYGIKLNSTGALILEVTKPGLFEDVPESVYIDEAVQHIDGFELGENSGYIMKHYEPTILTWSATTTTTASVPWISIAYTA